MQVEVEEEYWTKQSILSEYFNIHSDIYIIFPFFIFLSSPADKLVPGIKCSKRKDYYTPPTDSKL
jgi:hypothetical protein